MPRDFGECVEAGVERQIIRRDPPQHETSRLQPVGAVRQGHSVDAFMWIALARVDRLRSKRRRAPSTPTVARVASTRRWPAPLNTNAGATPTLAMTRPAAAGPTIRAPLNAAALSATALTTSSRPTVSFTNDCRTTLKSVLARPAHSARTPRCQYATTPVATSVATVSAAHACAAWVAMGRRLHATPTAKGPTCNGPRCAWHHG